MITTSLLTKDYENRPPVGYKSKQTQFQYNPARQPTAVPQRVPFDLRAKARAGSTIAYSLQCWHRGPTPAKMDGHNNSQSTGRRGRTESPEHDGVMQEASHAT